MSELLDFLIENPVNNITDKVIVSERLKDKPFTIRAMTGDEFFEYQKSATKYKKGQKVEFDNRLFHITIVANQTVEPNFKDAESIYRAGVQTSAQFIEKVLLSGEIAALADKITFLSGFDQEIDDLIDEAKN
ncbi:hypothetical protein FACS1894191_5600 [Clostridia bacterium]|nr:hypothetical protein FACS1894191_5600 [Clostridia bacterium]